MIQIEKMNRREALLSWKDFIPRIGSYAGSRNHVQTAKTNVSGLSAAIRFRLLLEDEITEETLRHYPAPVVEKWLQEICWRRYWKGWLESHPADWTHWRQRLDSLRQTLSAETESHTP